MAIQIDTKTRGEELKAEKTAKQRVGLKIIIGALIAAIGITVISAVVMGIDVNNDIVKQQELNAGIMAEYEAMQAQANANKEFLEEKAEEDKKNESNKVDKPMYSAQEAGETVCEFLDMAFRDQLLLTEDKQQWASLCGKADANWYGSSLDPSVSPIKWELLTWYDSINKNYEVVWGCYAPDAKGVYKYLLCVRIGTYNGDTNSFSIGTMYKTTFGEMYEKYGRIENTGSSNVSQEVTDMVDQLLSEESSIDNNSNVDAEDENINNESNTPTIFPGTSGTNVNNNINGNTNNNVNNDSNNNSNGGSAADPSGDNADSYVPDISELFELQ